MSLDAAVTHLTPAPWSCTQVYSMLYACSVSFVQVAKVYSALSAQASEPFSTCEYTECIIHLQQFESTSGSPPFFLGFSVVDVPFIFGGFAHASAVRNILVRKRVLLSCRRTHENSAAVFKQLRLKHPSQSCVGLNMKELLLLLRRMLLHCRFVRASVQHCCSAE